VSEHSLMCCLTEQLVSRKLHNLQAELFSQSTYVLTTWLERTKQRQPYNIRPHSRRWRATYTTDQLQLN